MDLERNLGEQPLAALMAAKGLKPADLVTASPTPISHKMVARGMKGRRLTSHSIELVRLAFNAAAQSEVEARELFNYVAPPLRERRAQPESESSNAAYDAQSPTNP